MAITNQISLPGNHRLKTKQRSASAGPFSRTFHFAGIPLLLRSVGIILPKGAIGRASDMVDILKKSLEQLESPVCPACSVDMRWSRSTLVNQSPITISHLFVCPNCNRTSETKSQVSTRVAPPTKLSAPRICRAA